MSVQGIIRNTAAATVLTLGMASAAHASLSETIIFDTDGPGGAFGDAFVTNFDWAPGNILANDCLPAPRECTVMIQTKLGAFVAPGGGGVAWNSVTEEYTLVVITKASSSIAGNVITFTNVDDDDNILEIYHDTSPDANAGTGEGFRDGKLILSAKPKITNFSIIDTTGLAGLPSRRLDTTNPDNTPGVWTVQGTGSAQFEADIDSSVHTIDTDYFKGDFVTQVDAMVMDLVDGGNAQVPFTQVEPSKKFLAGDAEEVTPDYGDTTSITGADLNNDGVANDGLGAVADIKYNNFSCDGRALPEDDIPGAPCDLHLQGDASSAFKVLTEIPEPQSLALLGLSFGLMGLVGLRRRRG